MEKRPGQRAYEGARKKREAAEEKLFMKPTRKDRQSSDPSVSPTLSKSSNARQPKGIKRSRSDDEDAGESAPKKPKASPSDGNDKDRKPTPAPKARKIAKGKSPLPRPMQARTKKNGTKSSGVDVEMSDDSEPIKGIARVKKPMKTSPTHNRNTLGNNIDEELLELPDDEMEGLEQDSEDEADEDATQDTEQEMDIDDWIVHDELKPESKRKTEASYAKMARMIVGWRRSRRSFLEMLADGYIPQTRILARFGVSSRFAVSFVISIHSRYPAVLSRRHVQSAIAHACKADHMYRCQCICMLRTYRSTIGKCQLCPKCLRDVI
jgi:hypothetical protein